MIQHAECSICQNKELSISSGLTTCLNCGYKYPFTSKEKLISIGENTRIILTRKSEWKFICSLADEILKHDPYHPMGLYIKGKDFLKRGFVKASMQVYKAALEKVERELDANRVGYVRHYLAMHIVLSIKNYCVDRFDFAIKRFARKNTFSNKELIFDAVDEVYRLVTFVKEFIGLNIPDIAILSFFDEIVATSCPYLQTAIFQAYKKINEIFDSGDFSTYLVPMEALKHIIYITDGLYKYAHMSKGLKAMGDTISELLSCLELIEMQNPIKGQITNVWMRGKLRETIEHLKKLEKDCERKTEKSSFIEDQMKNWNDAHYKVFSMMHENDEDIMPFISRLVAFGIPHTIENEKKLAEKKHYMEEVSTILGLISKKIEVMPSEFLTAE